jgi:hypothetical protein
LLSLVLQWRSCDGVAKRKVFIVSLCIQGATQIPVSSQRANPSTRPAQSSLELQRTHRPLTGSQRGWVGDGQLLFT